MSRLPLHIEPLKHEGCIAWLVADPKSREALLVDPKLEDVNRYLTTLKNYGYTLKGVFDTHGHADHVTAAPALAEATGAAVYRHHSASAPCVNHPLREGDTIPLGDHRLSAREAFGHTPEHMVLLGEGVIFTGDTLLLKTCGRTDFPGGDARQQWRTLQWIARLPDDTVVYPGHDYRGLTFMTLYEIKQINERLKLAGEEEFVEVMGHLGLDLPQKLQESLTAAKTCSWRDYALQQGIVVTAE